MDKDPENNSKPVDGNSVKVEEYYQSLLKAGENVFKENEEYFWIKHEDFSAVRFPEFNLSKPDEKELKKVFKELKCYLLNYTFKPSAESEAESFLYNCDDKEYSIEKLSRSVRRNIRLAQRRLNYGFAEWDDILKHGLKAFADTRTRVGLSDGNEKTFITRFTKFAKNPAHKAAAAWLDDELVGFMSLIVVDNYVIIQGTFSTDEHRNLRPNNVMADFVLNYYLCENNFELVCYGLSSIQEDTGKEGLHYFKIKVGFDAIPVQRVFILHPNIAPFKSIIRFVLHLLLLVLPKNRKLKKAAGIMELIKSHKN